MSKEFYVTISAGQPPTLFTSKCLEIIDLERALSSEIEYYYGQHSMQKGFSKILPKSTDVIDIVV